MRYSIIIIFFLSCTCAFAQDMYSADFYFERRYWEEAITGYSKLLKKSKDQTDSLLFEKQLALAYYNAKNYQKSAQYFDFIKDSASNFSKREKEIYFQVLRTMRKYDEAKSLVNEVYPSNAYENPFTVFPTLNNPEMEGRLYNLKQMDVKFGKYFLGMALAKNLIILPLPKKDKEGETVGYDLFSVNQITDTTFAFSKKRTPTISKNKNVIFRGTPCYFDSLNILYSESVSTKKRFKPGRSDKNNLGKNGENYLQISLKGKPLSINSINSNSTSPFYLESNRVLFFSSDRYGGKGGYDIYYSINSNDQWSIPINLESINTEFDDVYPFVFENEIFFSSKGHENYGGLDVFFSKINLDNLSEITCSQPQNIGAPVNSSYDDFSMLWQSKSSGYFASNRPSDKENDNLFYFNYKRFDILSGIVMDQTGAVLDASVTIFKKNKKGDWALLEEKSLKKDGKLEYEVDLKEIYRFDIKYEGKNEKTMYFPDENAGGLRGDSKDYFSKIVLSDALITSTLIDQVTGKPIQGVDVQIYEIVNGVKTLVGTATTDKEGSWDFAFDRSRDYEVNIKKRGYDAKIFEIPSSRRKRNRQDFIDDMTNIALIPEAKKADIIRVDNIYFDFNSADIKPESYVILNNIIAFLTAKPDVIIEIGAHTDAVGPDKYNYKLSVKRAKSCYNYLVEKGINPKRLRSKGYGEKKILNGCGNRNKCSDEENAVNRRIEIKIL